MGAIKVSLLRNVYTCERLGFDYNWRIGHAVIRQVFKNDPFTGWYRKFSGVNLKRRGLKN